MTRPLHDNHDPLKVVLGAEEATCKGCQYLERASNGMKDYCTNPDQRSPLAVKRCELYEEAE
jgi:hypothetical protein